jgi:hypothetical protein
MNETKIQPIFIKNYFNDSPIPHFRPFSNEKVAGYILENVYLHTGSGVVLDKNFKIIKETANDYSFWMPTCIHAFPQKQKKTEIYKRIKNLQKIIDSNKNKKEIIKIEKQSIHLLTPKNTYSFGHIFDYLQKIRVLQKMQDQEDFLYLISDNSLIKDFHIYLQTFGINPNKCIIPNNLGKLLFFKKMIFPFSPEDYEIMSEECYIKYINKMKEKTLIHIDEYKNLKEVNLYLSRNKNTRLGRKVIDEEVLLEYLKDKNFITLNGDESLYEIIFLFSKAKFIFGLHGSLFLNAIYCNNNCKILELNSRIHTKYAYKDNTRFFLKKENYEVINIKKDDKLNVQSQDIIDILKNYI